MKTIKILCYSYHAYIFRVFLSYRDTVVDDYRLEFYHAIGFVRRSNRRRVEDGIPPGRLIHGSLGKVYQTVKPDLVISATPRIDLRKLVPTPLLVYQSHGFWITPSKVYMDSVRSSGFLPKYDRLLMNKWEEAEARQLFGDRVRIMNTTPQLDYLSGLDLTARKAEFCARVERSTGELVAAKPKEPLDPDTRFILLVHNHRGTNDYDRFKPNPKGEIDEYHRLLTTTLEFAEAHNYHLITRYKGDGQAITASANRKNPKVLEIEQLHRSPNCTHIVFTENMMIYDLFFAEIFVIETGGTTMIEAYYHTPKVVRAQFHHWSEMFALDRYPELVQARDQPELRTALERLDRDGFSDDYQAQRDSLIREFMLAPDRSTMPQIERELVDLYREKIESKTNADD